jgi:streptogramin lyase
MRFPRLNSIALAAASLAVAASLTGCGAGLSTSVSNVTAPKTATPTIRMRGKVRGGQQPISGASIQLYAVGTSGNGSYATPLLAAPASTDASGSFSITGQYQCPQQGALTYLVATGGNPGLADGTNNAAISLMAVLGACNTANPDTNGDGGFYYTLDPNLSVNMDEVTTVAGVYALAPFMGNYYFEVGSASTPSGSVGIATAFTNAGMLADISIGTSPGPALPTSVTYQPVNGVDTGFPTIINTLADIIAACVNSDGTGSACSKLFGNYANIGVYPSDTIGAVYAAVTHPGTNVSDLFKLTHPTPPFLPELTIAPNDWTIGLHYTGLNLNVPASIAFDGLSNLWVANAGSNFITELYSGADGFNITGTSAQYTGGGLLGPQALAVDGSNNVWIANTAASSVVELDNSGNVLSGNGFVGGGINAPVSISLDTLGNIWVANFNGNSITQLASDGTPSPFSPILQGLATGNTINISLPTVVAVDPGNDVWVSNSGLNLTVGLTTGMLEFDQNGNPINCTTTALADPIGIAFDASGNTWVASRGNSAVQLLNPGCSSSTPPISGGGLNSTVAVAVDGAGSIWVANHIGSISELTASSGTPASPAAGFGTLNSPAAIAIDASGSVWTANTADNSLTEFIGLASPPAATPIVSNFAKMNRRKAH